MSRGMVGRKPEPKCRTRRTETGYQAGELWVSVLWNATPDNYPEEAQVNPARPDRQYGVLPWEISWSATAMAATLMATCGDGPGEVSRGHSTHLLLVGKGRIFYCKEQTGTLDESGVAANRRVSIRPV